MQLVFWIKNVCREIGKSLFSDLVRIRLISIKAAKHYSSNLKSTLLLVICSVFALFASQDINNLSAPESVTYLDTNGSYIVKNGDTFWDIAFDFLGNPYEWQNIWQGNPHILNPNLIFPGDILMISAWDRNDSSSLKKQVSLVNNNQLNPCVKTMAQKNPNTITLKKSIVLCSNFFLKIPFLWTKRDSSGSIYLEEVTVDRPADKEFYQLFDNISFSLAMPTGLKIGDTVDIFSSVSFVHFKNTTANLVKISGRAKVVSINEKKGTAQLFEMFDLIRGKERIAKSGVNESREIYGFIRPDTTIRAKVLERIEKTGSPYLFQNVIINQGFAKGIKIGDMFAIFHNTERPVMIGYVGKLTAESSTLVIVNIMENAVSSGDEAVLIARSRFEGE